MHSCMCNTAIAEVKNISERDTSLLQAVSDWFVLWFTAEKEATEKVKKVRCVTSDVSLHKISLRLVMLFAHHQSHNVSESLLGTTFASTSMFRPNPVLHLQSYWLAEMPGYRHICLLKHHVISLIEAVF